MTLLFDLLRYSGEWGARGHSRDLSGSFTTLPFAWGPTPLCASCGLAQSRPALLPGPWPPSRLTPGLPWTLPLRIGDLLSETWSLWIAAKVFCLITDLLTELQSPSKGTDRNVNSDSGRALVASPRLRALGPAVGVGVTPLSPLASSSFLLWGPSPHMP